MRGAAILLLTILATVSLAALEPPPEALTSPVSMASEIIQAHGGSFSHNKPWSHYSLDFHVPEGTPVVAARKGTVTLTFLVSTIGDPDYKYAFDSNTIKIQHSDGSVAHYLHLLKAEPVVFVGEEVQRGEVIGYVGRTGWTGSYHLHFNVLKAGASIPVPLFGFAKNGGIPVLNDRVAAPPPPAVPQEVVDRTKPLLRTVIRAEKLGWPDTGYLLLKDLPKVGDHTDYPPYVKLVEMRAAFIAAAGELAAKSAERSDRAFVLARIEATAEKTRELRPLLDTVRKALADLPDEQRSEARSLRATMRKFIHLLPKECSGETMEAVNGYCKHLRRAKGGLRRFLIERLTAIFLETRERYDRETKRRRVEMTRLPEASKIDFLAAVVGERDRAMGVVQKLEGTGILEEEVAAFKGRIKADSKELEAAAR